MKPILLALAAVVPGAASARPQLPPEIVPKQVVGSAADVRQGLLRLPHPETVVYRSRASWHAVAPGTAPAFLEIPIGTTGPLSLAALSADVAEWDVRVHLGDRAEGARALADAGLAARTMGALPPPLAGARVERFDLERARRGTLRLEVTAPAGARGGWIAVADATPLQLAAHLTSHDLFVDGVAGVAAILHDASRPGGEPVADAVERATLVLGTGGSEWAFPMNDDGAGLDERAGDGVYTARIPPGVEGRVTARVRVDGRTPSGAALRRDAFLSFPVVERRATFTGDVAAEAATDGSLHLALGVASRAGEPPRLHASAEVWGTDRDGAPVPVAWLSRIAPPVATPDGWAIRLELAAGVWTAAGAEPPLELRAVRLQDPDTHLPYDQRTVLALPLPAWPAAAQAGDLDRAPDPASTALAPLAPRPRALMLVHGYCSSGVWPFADFTQPFVEFLDIDQNRTHDEFAQLLGAFGTGLDSFGVVAHSQGGPAALQLYTYYASGLDHAAGGRRIQSVGSPYLGTPLAPLGDVVPGVGCGANFDLGPTGSALWLAGIPSAARAEAHHWTTSETTFFACNVFSDFVLGDPNDGVVEMAGGQLPGGVSMGHTLGWCHSTGMNQPAHYTDSARNGEMNAEAAR